MLEIKKDIRLLIVDDHRLIREGIKSTLQFQDLFTTTIDEAEDGLMAIDMAKSFDYDLILMDINMPNMDGDKATRKILDIRSDLKIICLSMHDEPIRIKGMFDAGVMGYVLKNTSSTELTLAISTVLAGKKYFSNDIALSIMDGTFTFSQANSKSLLLSKREIEILKLIAMEKTNEEISNALFVSKRTIDTHRQNMINKLGVRNTVGLIKYGMENDLFD